jgi:DNA polymerase III subunit chi
VHAAQELNDNNLHFLTMPQVSFYQTTHSLLFKTAAQLLEKCYDNNLKTVLIIEGRQIEEIDKFLWTYSKKGFLPHGTKNDPLPEKQPIYISDLIENPNGATVLMLVNPVSIDLKQDFQRVIIIHDEKQSSISDIRTQLTKSGATCASYKQNLSGSWGES